jgi:trimeric autotransporter adhesin
MKKLVLSFSKNVFTGAAIVVGLMGNSAWAACTFTSMFNAQQPCLDTVNNTETGLATTNTNLATTNTNLATTNTNLAATNNNLATTNTNLATTNTNLATTNTNLATTNTNLATTNNNLATTNTNVISGDAATLTSSKAYTDAKALSVGADTLAAASNYTNAKSAETLKSANTYTDTRAAETLKSANAFTSDQVAKLESKTAGGVAAIAAMASVPQLSAGKDLSIGVGVGSYDGKTAVSIGLNKRINESMTARFNFASGVGSGSKPVVGAGAAWEY